MHHNFSLEITLVYDRLLCTLYLHNLSICLPVTDKLGYFLRSSFLAKPSNNLILTLMGFNLITPHCCSFLTLLLSLNPEFYRLNTNSSASKSLCKVCYCYRFFDSIVFVVNEAKFSKHRYAASKQNNRQYV